MMSGRRRQLLGFVESYTRQHGVSPKLSDIASAIGITQSGVSQHLDVLERDGFVSRLRGQRGMIRVTQIKEAPAEVMALINLIDELRSTAHDDTQFYGNRSVDGHLFERIGDAAAAARIAVARMGV